MRSEGAHHRFTIVDLFSGCGGLTAGFVSAQSCVASFEPVAAVEVDRDAAVTYAANFGPIVFHGDIAEWVGMELPAADIVIGGPPCQGFSALGKRDPEDDRNKLWRHYAEAVARIRPYYFVLENVPPFLNSTQFKLFKIEMSSHGLLTDYTIEESPLTVVASEHGSAQRRRRAVVIGRLRDLPPIKLKKIDEPRTVEDAIGGVPFEVVEKNLPMRLSPDIVQVAGEDYEHGAAYRTSELHLTRNFTELSLRRFANIPPDGNRHNLPDELLAPCWRKGHDGSHDVMGRLHWDRPSVTIRTEFWKPEKGRYLHPVADRPITHMEAALLQGFAFDFKWFGTKVAIGRQIGNAVPVELGRAIAEAMLAELVGTGVSPRTEGAS